MGTVGDLIAKLFCDSTDFDKNIKKSQKEVQEFKRKTEQNAAKVNSALNNMGSVAGKVSPKIGSLVGSLGKLGTVAAVGGAAIGGLSEIVKHNEFLTDAWEKKVTQASGALDSLWTTMAQGANSWRNLISNLKESIRLYGQLAEIKDNLGTLEGFALVSGSNVEAKISKYKEDKKNPNATKEQIAKARKEAEDAINEDYIVTLEQKKWLKEQYKTQVGDIYSNTINRRSPVNKEKGQQIIKNFIEDKRYYNRYKDALSKISGTTPVDQLINNKFFKSLVKNLFKDAYDYDSLFNPALLKYNRGTIAGIRDFLKNLDILPEAKYLRPAQETLASINSLDATASAKKNAYFKQLATDDTIKPGKGGSVYTSKQEAPKERTLQDMLDDLDKSLVWNKYLAQNLGEDITGLNLSSLEKTANELKDLLKNTTDEEQRKQIISVLKTIYNNTTKAKEIKKPVNSANFEGIYGNEIGNLSLNDKSAEYKRIKEEIDKEIENELKKNVPENFIRGCVKGINIQEAISAEIAKEFKYDADRFLKDKYIGEPSDIIKRTVQSIFDAFKLNDFGMNANLDGALNATDLSYDPLNNKIKSFIPFGNLSKLDIPIKYPEIFYSSSLASSKFSSGVSAIVKKFTGFDNFNRDFAKSAYSKFDKLIEEGNIITPNDVNKILYQVYLDTIRKHSDNTPDFFKNDSDFYKFIKDRTDIKFDPNNKEANSKVNLILGEKNKNELIYQELLNNIGSAKIAKAGLNNDLTNLNTNSRTISNINFGSDYIIGFINELSKGNIYEKAEILKNIKNALVERRKILTEYMLNFDTGEDRIKLEDRYKNLRLIQLEKEKRSNKGVLSDDKQKEYEELIKELGSDYSKSTDTQLDTYAEQSTREAEKLAKLIEENNKIRKDLEDKTNQTDEIDERIRKEEYDNNVLRERQKTLNELSNKYMSVADSAYQIGTAFSSLDSEFGDVAGSIFNIIGITSEAIGKILGMATAEGTLSAMKLPWPKNLAAIATVIAAGASVASQVKGVTSRKYATGGIVSGPGTGISDSIPIRVSNGEMILNHRQQSNLFNLLDKGSSTEGKIEFKNKLVGSDIIGSATTYNKRRNLIL